jgi:hypothetical protein
VIRSSKLRGGPQRVFDLAFVHLAADVANVSLPPLGTLRLSPASLTLLPPVFVPCPSGLTSTTIPVPSDPALSGLSVYSQALLVQYPASARLTNLVSQHRSP